MAVLERTCCGCFAKKAKSDLIAVTMVKNGIISVNADGKLHGRSAYLCRDLKCLTRARDRKGKNGLEFTLKHKLPETIWNDLEKIIKLS